MNDWLVYDLETNGLLPEPAKKGEWMDRIHCIAIEHADGVKALYWDSDAAGDQHLNWKGDVRLHYAGSVAEGMAYLREYEGKRYAHNGLRFDENAMRLVDEEWEPLGGAGVALDSQISAKVTWPDIKLQDFKRRNRLRVLGRPDNFPGHLIGRHSLQAWGYRLGNHKGDYDGGWKTINHDMLLYCLQDVSSTADLVRLIFKRWPGTWEPYTLEHEFAENLDAMMATGVAFDIEAAEELTATLVARRAELDDELKAAFGDFTNVYYTPKKKLRREKTVAFNPNSRDHIARALKEKYGWKPTAFTDGGKPKVDETVVAGLNYPEAKAIGERLMIQKRLGQVAEGNKAWLKLVREDGRIYPRIDHAGAGTTRCTHSDPNVTQVPSADGRAPYGVGCRKLWIAPDGYRFVGADVSGLEVRLLAHFLARYDGGEYAKIVLEEDIHTRNQQAAGLATRTMAKTWFYAWLYGAGDGKLGKIAGENALAAKKRRGRFETEVKGLKEVKANLAMAAKRGWLKALDGRHIPIRSPHSALNTALQGNGSIVVKYWTNRVARRAKREGLIRADRWTKFPEADWGFIIHAHDEMQAQVRARLARIFAQIAEEEITKTGRALGLRIRLEGESKTGANWAETH